MSSHGSNCKQTDVDQNCWIQKKETAFRALLKWTIWPIDAVEHMQRGEEELKTAGHEGPLACSSFLAEHFKLGCNLPLLRTKTEDGKVALDRVASVHYDGTFFSFFFCVSLISQSTVSAQQSVSSLVDCILVHRVPRQKRGRRQMTLLVSAH